MNFILCYKKFCSSFANRKNYIEKDIEWAHKNIFQVKSATLVVQPNNLLDSKFLNESSEKEYDLYSDLADSFTLRNIFFNLILRTELSTYEPEPRLIGDGKIPLRYGFSEDLFKMEPVLSNKCQQL